MIAVAITCLPSANFKTESSPYGPRLLHRRGFLPRPLRLQNLVKQKEIRKQRAKVDRSIQVSDQLGTDASLRQDKLNGREGIAGVALQYTEESSVLAREFRMIVFHFGRVGFREPGNCIGRTLKKIAHLRAGGATFVAR